MRSYVRSYVRKRMKRSFKIKTGRWLIWRVYDKYTYSSPLLSSAILSPLLYLLSCSPLSLLSTPLLSFLPSSTLLSFLLLFLHHSTPLSSLLSYLLYTTPLLYSKTLSLPLPFPIRRFRHREVGELMAWKITSAENPANAGIWLQKINADCYIFHCSCMKKKSRRPLSD